MTETGQTLAYQDITLTCRDCGEPFIFSAGEQEFYAQKGFLNNPVRCPACRRARKEQRNRRSDSDQQAAPTERPRRRNTA